MNKKNKRYNKRQKTTTQRLMPVAKILTIFFTISLTLWGMTKIKDIDSLKTVFKWQIDSSLLITQAELEKKIQPLIKNKYLLDLVEIKHLLESEPWIATAQVKRSFFNTVKINIETQQIAMRWENTDCKMKSTPNCSGYISNTGTLFIPKKQVKSDVVLARSKADKASIAQLYQDYLIYQNATKKRIKSFSRTHIDKLVFEPNIKVVLGYQQKQQRLVRFLKVYAKLRKKIAKKKLNRATFDMRYPKGFSVKW